jgi:hypothetical protein
MASGAGASPAERSLSEYHKQDWQVEDGLPEGNVRAIVQDPAGPLLIATGSGVTSFDGLRFAPVRIDARDEAANEPVNALLFTRNGDLWIGTDDRGVIHRVGGRAVYISEAAGLTDERVRAMVEDRGGVVWQCRAEPAVWAGPGERGCLDVQDVPPGGADELTVPRRVFQLLEPSGV